MRRGPMGCVLRLLFFSFQTLAADAIARLFRNSNMDVCVTERSVLHGRAGKKLENTGGSVSISSGNSSYFPSVENRRSVSLVKASLLFNSSC